MPVPGGTPITTTPDRRTLIRTAIGGMCRTMATSGCRMSQTAGFHIVMAVGHMSPTTDGRGLVMSHGDGLPITMAAGSRTAIRGPGGRVRFTLAITRSGPPRTYRSLDGAAASAPELAMVVGAASAGFPLGLATTSIRGGVAIAAVSVRLVSVVELTDSVCSYGCT